MIRPVNYDAIAAMYDRRYEDSDYNSVLQFLFAFIGNVPWGDILEVGCGTGHWLLELAHRSYRVIGLDPARSMLDLARRKLPSAIVVQGRAEVMPWCEGTFDRLFCINAFHHFADKERFIAEARRVLRHGGGVMIVGLDPHTGLDHWWIYDYFPQVIEIDRRRYPPVGQIRQLMSDYGFMKCRTVEVRHTPIQLPARMALEKGRLAKTTTSQLAILTDNEYNEGINRLIEDIEIVEAKNDVLKIGADLRLYATTGWVR